MSEYDKGTQKLIDDLLAKPQSFARGELLRHARKGYFHDYKSQYDAPKVALVSRLRAASYDDLKQNAIDGLYDQGKEDAQEWAASPEGKEVLGEVFTRTDKPT